MTPSDKRERMREGERTMLWLRQVKAILNELELRLTFASELQGIACQITPLGVLGWWSVGVHSSLLCVPRMGGQAHSEELSQWGSPLRMRVCQETSHFFVIYLTLGFQTCP